jgi:hypothetical protein
MAEVLYKYERNKLFICRTTAYEKIFTFTTDSIKSVLYSLNEAHLLLAYSKTVFGSHTASYELQHYRLWSEWKKAHVVVYSTVCRLKIRTHPLW